MLAISFLFFLFALNFYFIVCEQTKFELRASCACARAVQRAANLLKTNNKAENCVCARLMHVKCVCREWSIVITIFLLEKAWKKVSNLLIHHNHNHHHQQLNSPDLFYYWINKIITITQQMQVQDASHHLTYQRAHTHTQQLQVDCFFALARWSTWPQPICRLAKQERWQLLAAAKSCKLRVGDTLANRLVAAKTCSPPDCSLACWLLDDDDDD